MKNDLPKELKMSRIWQHIENNTTFAVISAYINDIKKNDKYHQELKSRVRSLGLGFTELKGGFIKNDKLITEKALVIANIGKKDILMLAEKFKQERFLFKNKKMFVEYGKNDIEGIWETLKIFENDGEQSKFEFTRDILKYYYGSLLGASIGFKNIFVKEVEPIGFNRIAYNSYVPLQELNLDDIK